MASGPGPVRVGGAPGGPRKTRDAPACPLPDVCPEEHAGGRGWTVHDSRVNLPAALNDPRLAKRESDFFTKSWGADFVEGVPAPSPGVARGDTDCLVRYLRDGAQRERNHERCRDARPLIGDETAVANGARVLPLLASDEGRDQLDQLPKIFVRPDFALNDPATFGAVLPWSHFGGRSGRDGASSRLLQEKLSHYLDVVEVSLARQISLRSEAFFHAVSSQRQLQGRLSGAAGAVRALRAQVAAAGRGMSRGPLRALGHALARRNCLALHSKLKLMAAVQQTQPTVQLLLSTSEFVGALELIGTTKEVLQQELQGVHSFRHLGSQLCEMEKLIDKMMVADFTTYARADLNRTFEEDSQVLEKDRLLSLVFGLLRQRKLDFLNIYGQEMLQAAKGIVRECVIRCASQIEEIDTDGVGRLHDQMRMMTFSQWFELLQNVFEHFLVFLTRIKATLGVIRGVVLELLDGGQRGRVAGGDHAHRDEGAELLRAGEAELAALTHEGPFISDALSASGRATPTLATPTRDDASGSDSASATTESSSSREQNSAPSPEDAMPSDLELGRVANSVQELLHSASDLSHDRCVKVLLSRAKDGSLERLSSAEFVRLSRAVETFAQDTEALCGRRSVSLRGALQSQANRFVQRFHEERRNKLSLLLDTERWKQAEVPAEFQLLVDSMADGRVALPERRPPEDRRPADYLLVDEQKYAVVGTVLLLVRMFLEYCQCVSDIPSIATDMLTRLSDLLKHFNSRSCQLVLGAGALQIVGLKTITTKNLALVSRCLQLIVHFVPLIRAHFESKLHPKQYNILRHFDHISKDYNDHIAEISAKLVAIMDGLFEKALTKYEVKAPMPSLCFRNICKQMAKMHEAIHELLPEDQTRVLFSRINASFKLHLKRQLARLGVVNDGGPQHGLMVVDVAFYTENVQALRSLENLDLNMPEIWEQKR